MHLRPCLGAGSFRDDFGDEQFLRLFLYASSVITTSEQLEEGLGIFKIAFETTEGSTPRYQKEK